MDCFHIVASSPEKRCQGRSPDFRTTARSTTAVMPVTVPARPFIVSRTR